MTGSPRIQSDDETKHRNDELVGRCSSDKLALVVASHLYSTSKDERQSIQKGTRRKWCHSHSSQKDVLPDAFSLSVLDNTFMRFINKGLIDDKKQEEHKAKI